LPESAIGTINSRIDIYSNPDEVKDIYSSLIEPIAEKYSFRFNGKTFTDGPIAGNISLTVDQPGEPSPISPSTGKAWEVFAKAVQASFGPEVVSAPSAMTGNTDCRHYVSYS
jgi:Gly-Xaa carboxypeptidase